MVFVNELQVISWPRWVKIIKIDVEGGELEVLQGATQLLAKSRAHWIIELNLRSYSLDKVLALSPSLNLTLYS